MADQCPVGAIANVFSIVELLEAILLQVDMATLLVSASRVSRAWHNVMMNSIAIQQALYFKPTPAKTHKHKTHKSTQEGAQAPRQSSTCEEPDEIPQLNPLLMEKFSPCFFDLSGDRIFFRRSGSFYALPWTARPHEEVDFTHPFKSGSYRTLRKPTAPTAEAARQESLARSRFTRKGASWRRMLVSQPPPLQLGYLSPDIFLSLRSPPGSDLTTRIALVTLGAPDIPPGLRMGQLYDLVQYRAGHHPLHSLWFRIHWMQPRGPFCMPACRRVCQELLTKTSVVLEMVDDDDQVWANHPRSPLDAKEFDEAFRSCDFSISKVETEEMAMNSIGIPGWPSAAYVWDKDPAMLEEDGWNCS
ncbi:putative F-box domain-containing protein [Seiridium cardinale]